MYKFKHVFRYFCSHILPVIIMLAVVAIVLFAGCRQPWTNYSYAGSSNQIAIKVGPKYGIVFFTSKDCKWCIKMKKDVWTNKLVKKNIRRFDWYEVDINKQPKLAKAFKIKNLPTTVMIKYTKDRKNCTIIRKRVGYMTTVETVIFLRIPVNPLVFPLSP